MISMIKLTIIGTCLFGGASLAINQSIQNAPRLPVASEVYVNNSISADKAKQIAVANAGYIMDDVVFTEVCEEYDDGLDIIKVEFEHDYLEYEYEIDTSTGTILGFKIDSEYDD